MSMLAEKAEAVESGGEVEDVASEGVDWPDGVEGRCQACGHVLEAGGDRCPECGAALGQEFSTGIRLKPSPLVRGIAWGALLLMVVTLVLGLAAFVLQMGS